MCDAQDVDKAVMILTNDNLELACQVVEKTASEKAIREVDERLQMAYQVGLPCSGPHPRHVQLLSDVELWQCCNVLRVHQGKAGQRRDFQYAQQHCSVAWHRLRSPVGSGWTLPVCEVLCHIEALLTCDGFGQLRANARKAGQEYIDNKFMHGRYPSTLPHSLTARSGHLTPQQQYVYDDFARVPRALPKEGECPFHPSPCHALLGSWSGE